MITITIEQAVYNRLAYGPVTVKGAIKVDVYRRGSPVWMPVGGQADVPAWGKCSSVLQQGGYASGTMLKVDCESPDITPPYSSVTLRQPETGQEWPSRLWGGGSPTAHPAITWLSPLHHRDAAFQITTSDAIGPQGGRWLVPQDALATAKIEVAQESPAGSAVVRFEFPTFQLNEYRAGSIR